MSTLSDRLDPHRFARIHRSGIVNVQHVKTINPGFDGHHVVTTDTGG